MSDFPECDKFTGRLRAICRNEAGLPTAATNGYRRGWGFTEIPDEAISTAVQQPVAQRPPRLVIGVGTNLANLLKSWGINVKTGCTCEEWIKKMDGWSIEENREHRQEIIDHLKKEKGEANIGLIQKAGIGVMMMTSGVRPTIAGMVDEAIRQTERAEEQAGVYPYYPPLVDAPIDRTKLKSHILYHVMPIKGETEWVWRRHLEWLREVRHEFNGRLIIGIVTKGRDDEYTYFNPSEVMKAVDGLDAEFLMAPNDCKDRQGLGEGVLFLPMLEKLKTRDPNEVMFYGHCKGVTRPGPPDGVPHRWAKAAFDTLFRNRDSATDALDNHGVCGPFLMPGGYEDGLPGVGSKYFFSGTFFAMRLYDVFRRKWQDLPRHYGCVEQYPRVMFDRDTEAKSLFMDGVNNLYDETYWNDVVQPELDRWYETHLICRNA